MTMRRRVAEVDRMLCFDCDTVCTGSLKQLLTFDMKGASVWGVQDTVNPYFVRAIGKDETYRYINCGGVIVIDLENWRKSGIETKFVEYVTEWNGNPPFVDQGTINKLCKTEVLSPAYNVINPMFMYSVKQIKSLFKIQTYYTQDEIDAVHLHIKRTSIASKVFFQKSEINPSLKPVHQCTNQTVIQPIITHPEERIWVGRTPPAEAPGPGRSEEWHTESHENICE